MKAGTEPLNEVAVPHTKKPQGAQGGGKNGLKKITDFNFTELCLYIKAFFIEGWLYSSDQNTKHVGIGTVQAHLVVEWFGFLISFEYFFL